MTNIIIFGAGIAGLTAAHELLERGYDVTIYEKSESVGGFAKSKRKENGAPTEHSWRGYGPFYKNFFDIAKRIPVKDDLNSELDTTVFDNLSRPIKFELQNDIVFNKKPTLWDNIYVGYYVLQGLLSNKRREYYSQISFKNLIENKISKAGTD